MPASRALFILLLPVLSSTPAWSDASTCRDLTARFQARQKDLAPPQVSAALFAAADDGCEDLAKQVLDFGASVAARDHSGGTALTHAARSGDVAVIKLLVGHGADVEQQTVAGSTPLFVAAENDRPQAVQALIGLGAKVNIAGRGGVTPLSAAAYNGRLKIVDVLLTHGADPALQDNTGKTPLLYAAARGFKSVVDRLLATGIDVNAAYGNDLTVLMWAAGHADDVPVDDGVALVTALLDTGARIDAVDDRGRTALMTAAERGHEEIVALLLRRGAKGDVRDKAGASAADLATSAALKATLAAR